MASWLSGFAEKAEELLNRVDQSAAAVVVTASGALATPAGNMPTLRIPPETSIKEEGGDASGPSSNISSVDYQTNVSSEGSHLLTTDMLNDPPSSASSSSYALVNAPPESITPVGAAAPAKETSSEVAALRGEVQLLSQELQSVTTRARRAQRELHESEAKIRAQNEQLHASERRIREIEAQENDHQEMLKVRETQLEATRNQLEELKATMPLQEGTQLGASDGMVVQRLREELQRAQQKSSSFEDELAGERRKVRDLDMQLVQVKGEAESDRESTQSRLADLERRLAQQRTASSEASAQLRHWQTEADHAKLELAEYKEKANRVLQSKERLIASLQSSEEGGSAPAAAGSLGLQVQQLTAELEEVRSERDWLRDELANERLAVETLRSEQRELEAQISTNNDTATERAQAAADALQAEHRQRVAATAEAERWRQTAESAELEIARTRADFESRVAQLEQEAVRLRAANRVNQASTGGGFRGSIGGTPSQAGDAELVGRLQALTESLVQKQLVVETVTAEKNSFAAQLARMERQYRDLVEMSSGEDGARSTSNGMVRTSSSNVLISGLGDDLSTRLRPGAGNAGAEFHRPIMRESAFDSQFSRTAKQIINQLDKFAGHTSIVFRRFPLARPFLLVYMTLLHLWVTFVLLTYQPEIHHNDLTINAAHNGVILPPMPIESNNQVAFIATQHANP